MNLFKASLKTLNTASKEHHAKAKLCSSPKMQAKHSIIADNIDNELRCRARGWSNAAGKPAQQLRKEKTAAEMVEAIDSYQGKIDLLHGLLDMRGNYDNNLTTHDLELLNALKDWYRENHDET